MVCTLIGWWHTLTHSSKSVCMDWGSQSGLVGPFSENLIIARHSGAFRDKISQMRVPGTGMSQSLDTNSQPKLLVLTQNAFIVKHEIVSNLKTSNFPENRVNALIFTDYYTIFISWICLLAYAWRFQFKHFGHKCHIILSPRKKPEMGSIATSSMNQWHLIRWNWYA